MDTVEVLRAWVNGQAAEWHGAVMGANALEVAKYRLHEDGFLPESSVIEYHREFSYSYHPYEINYRQVYWSDKYGRADLYWVVEYTPDVRAF